MANPAKFERCVKAVKKRGGAANAYGVCTAAGTKTNPSYRIKFSNGLWRVYDRSDLLHNAETKLEAEQWLRNKKRMIPRPKRNPSEYAAAAEASEEFHGTPPHEDILVKTKIFEHEHLGDCGELVSMVIIAPDGKLVTLSKFGGARLARSPKGYPYQLFIEGGDQEVDLKQFRISKPHEIEVLGKLKFVTYYTVKHHLGRDGGEANYKHKLNDAETLNTKAKNRPTVVYDVMSKLLSIAGGEYSILPEGIDN